jgi:putative oxidoreductase
MNELSVLQNASLVIARILFVAVFAFQDAIYNKIIYASRSIDYMHHFGLPFPQLLLVLTVAIELLAGFMIISGWKAQWGAFFILFFTVGVTFIFHRFWTYSDPAEIQNQLNHFMKNLSIMGGAIFIIVFGVGKYSL